MKQSPLGLMYLGKTTLNNHDSYLGSGKYWKLHIKKHNLHPKDIKTWVLHETEDKDDLIKIGLYYSKLLNIVDSKNWECDNNYGMIEGQWYSRSKAIARNNPNVDFGMCGKYSIFN